MDDRYMRIQILHSVFSIATSIAISDYISEDANASIHGFW